MVLKQSPPKKRGRDPHPIPLRKTQDKPHTNEQTEPVSEQSPISILVERMLTEESGRSEFESRFYVTQESLNGSVSEPQFPHL